MGIVYGYNLHNNYDFFIPSNGPFLIDGLDEMQDSHTLLHFLKEKYNFGIKHISIPLYFLIVYSNFYINNYIISM